ncbi:OLC1v1036674C1 [Oldenlandia corymbosa var. corymbosa]|uniref:OLC1v1036674C1 n=1 Tax=Oldenlandia corymbosa var. corymbosa TaxID=529605 RepID=A0AAV1CXD4_OLDCO|nr:OLC1v1036674C1 [Oldenlandia corymbosa var. corymbosa]
MVPLAPRSFQKILRLNGFSAFRHISVIPSFISQNEFPRSRGFSSEVEAATEFEFDEIPYDAKAVEKEVALRGAISQLANDFGKESMLSLQRFFGSRKAPVIPTGSLKLDLALGIGGLPKGRIVEIFGQEASGKTTLALHVIKEAQKLGGYCAYLDVENAMNPSLAESMGVNTQNLLISQPDCAENLLSMVDTLTKSGSVDVIVVDSVAALVPQLEIDSVEVGTTRDMQSRIMTQALRKIHYSLAHSRTLIIFVNQVRANLKPGPRYNPSEEVTCGGNALPFYAAIRLKLIRKKLLKTHPDMATGLEVCAKVIKNKLAPAMKDADLTIKFGRGICCVSEILDLACEHGTILLEGGSYSIEGETLNSKKEAEEYLARNVVVMEQVVSNLRSQLFERRKS